MLANMFYFGLTSGCNFPTVPPFSHTDFDPANECPSIVFASRCGFHACRAGHTLACLPSGRSCMFASQLGEEYCDLTPVTSDSFIPPSLRVRLMNHIAFFLVGILCVYLVHSKPCLSYLHASSLPSEQFRHTTCHNRLVLAAPTDPDHDARACSVWRTCIAHAALAARFATRRPVMEECKPLS